MTVEHWPPILEFSVYRSPILFVAVLLVAFSATEAQTADSLTAQVDRMIDWASTHTPGCDVAVSRNGRVVFARSWGMANLETGTPIGANTVFDAASIAKQMTAMSVLMLARDGTLSLDDDVRRWIPELPDYGTRITIRHLLTHTSGLRDFFEMLILARGRFEEDRITQADALAIVTRQSALNFTPGTEYLYSNTGYLLAALIVERASGQPLRQFADERMFTPLGMRHTSFRDDFTRVVEGRADGYARRGSDWRIATPNYDLAGPTSLYTTASDLLTWAANLESPRVGDVAVVRAMSTRAVLTNGDSTGYGLGLSIWNDGGARVLEHEGSDPGYRSYLGWYPDLHFAVAALCNTRDANAVGFGHAIAGVFLDTLLKRDQVARAQPKTAAPRDTRAPFVWGANALKRYEGTYWSDELESRYVVTAQDSTLLLRTGTSPGLVARPVSADSFASGQITIEFQRSGARVTGFQISHPRARHLAFVRTVDVPGQRSASYLTR